MLGGVAVTYGPRPARPSSWPSLSSSFSTFCSPVPPVPLRAAPGSRRTHPQPRFRHWPSGAGCHVDLSFAIDSWAKKKSTPWIRRGWKVRAWQGLFHARRCAPLRTVIWDVTAIVLTASKEGVKSARWEGGGWGGGYGKGCEGGSSLFDLWTLQNNLNGISIATTAATTTVTSTTTMTSMTIHLAQL